MLGLLGTLLAEILMRSLFKSSDHEHLRARLGRLTPTAQRRWGRMSSHQAVCHLCDWFRGVLGDRPIPGSSPSLRVNMVRWVAFTTPLPWPRGFRTAPEQDQEKGGTPPAEFDADVATLESLMAEFAQRRGRGLTPHWRWGQMPEAMWGRYGYRHVNHHLHQFGV